MAPKASVRLLITRRYDVMCFFDTRTVFSANASDCGDSWRLFPNLR